MGLRHVLLALMIGGFFGFAGAQFFYEEIKLQPNPYQIKADSLAGQTQIITARIDTIYLQANELDSAYNKANKHSDTTGFLLDLLYLSDSALLYYPD